MRKLLMVFVGCLFVLSCSKSDQNKSNKNPVQSSDFKEIKDITTVDYEGLEPLLSREDDKTYVVNFWATWCSPCVKELPYFERIGQEYKGQNVEVLLVSLDFPNQKNSRLIPFANRKKLQSELIHLDDPKEQEWIPKVNEEWSGALPATIIYNKNERKFFEQSFTYDSLEQELKQFLN